MTTTMQAPKLSSIVDVFAMRPATFAPLMQYAEKVMRGPGALGQPERELIATMTSQLNGCQFCRNSHKAVAEYLYTSLGQPDYVERVLNGRDLTPHEEAFWSLVDAGYYANPIPDFAREVLTAEEIHDAVTVIASFNLFNRLVEFYGIEQASDEANAATGERLATLGYVGL